MEISHYSHSLCMRIFRICGTNTIFLEISILAVIFLCGVGIEAAMIRTVEDRIYSSQLARQQGKIVILLAISLIHPSQILTV